MTQRYILKRRRHTAFRYLSNKRFPLMSASSLLRARVPACLCLSFRCFRAGRFPARSFPFGRAVGSNSIIDIPLLRCRWNFRRVSVLLPLTSHLRLLFTDTWLNPVSRGSNDVCEEVPAVEAYESKSRIFKQFCGEIK